MLALLVYKTLWLQTLDLYNAMVIPSKRSITTLVYKSMKLNFISYTKHFTAGTNDINSNNNILLNQKQLQVSFELYTLSRKTSIFKNVLKIFPLSFLSLLHCLIIANPRRFMLNSLDWYAVLWLSCLWEPLHNIRTSPALFGWNSTTDNASSGLSSTCGIKQTVQTGRGDILACACAISIAVICTWPHFNPRKKHVKTFFHDITASKRDVSGHIHPKKVVEAFLWTHLSPGYVFKPKQTENFRSTVSFGLVSKPPATNLGMWNELPDHRILGSLD